MDSTEDIKNDIQDIISTSTNLECDLIRFIVSNVSNINRVELYNTFHKFLNKYKDNNYTYDVIANIMDYIWSGHTGQVQLYFNELTDRDFLIRKSSKRIFTPR